jgi:hypothetical protein
MKKLVFLLFFVSIFFYGQSNKEIAEIYLVKAEEQLKKEALSKALVYFDRAIVLLGENTTAKVEEVGTVIYFKLEKYEEAKRHAQNYFSLTKDKRSERYKEVLYLYVEIEERIEAENKVKAGLLTAALLKQNEQKRLDSLTDVWKIKALTLSFEVDSIYEFDKNSIAIFKDNKGFYGVINDQGSVLVSPGINTKSLHYDGLIVMMEGVEDHSTKVTVYNTTTKESIVLPSVSSFNAMSTNYGKVMLPRRNGFIVSYPNNSQKVLVYDLNSKTFKETKGLNRYFDFWKNQKVIKKYNKENQIKIEKEYLDFGGYLGGFSAFYNQDGSLFGYISVGGKIVTSSQFKYIGTLTNGFLEAEKQDGTKVWLNEKGDAANALINENGSYSGTTVVNKVDSKYQFINEKHEIMKGEEVLESLEEYLKTH